MRLALVITFEDPAHTPITHNSEGGLSFDECLERTLVMMEAGMETNPEMGDAVIKSIMIYCMPDKDEENEV